jgi:hypothetical protein
VPTHSTIHTCDGGKGQEHLKPWLIETSVDGESWREVTHEEDSEQLNDEFFAGTFAVATCGECRFVRLVNICRNHRGNDTLAICAWEVFGRLVE